MRALLAGVAVLVLLPVLVIGYSRHVRFRSPLLRRSFLGVAGRPCGATYTESEFFDYFWPPEHSPWNARRCQTA